MALNIVEREMTGLEFSRMQSGFTEHAMEFGVTDDPEIRYTYVAMDDTRFVGCSSGLQHHSWFYLTDLWLEKPYRRKGLGTQLLQRLETRVVSVGVKNVYLWTAGYEAAPFYKEQGYSVFVELADYYSVGYSRIGFRKAL